MSEGAFDSESFLKSLTTRPGVYQMYGEEGELLYVGKARNLKNRVTSYFRASGLAAKTMNTPMSASIPMAPSVVRSTVHHQ